MPEEIKAAIDESLANLKKEYDIEEVDRIPIHGGQRRLPNRIWRINLPVEVSGKAEFLDVYMVFTNSFPFDMPAIKKCVNYPIVTVSPVTTATSSVLARVT